jgi:maltose alpha-D-glucosyltransferase/alpha-amylase
VRIGEAEQTNTSIVFDEAVILKIFRRLGLGPNPDLELGRMLTNAGFEHIPAQVGEITYEGEIDDEVFQIDLGIAQQFVPDATDGWGHLLERLDSFYDEVHDDDAPEDRRFLTDERAKELLEEIDQLGDATASLHVLLSREELDPAFLPEPLTSDDVTEISERVLARLGEFGDEESTWLDAGAISIIERLEDDSDLGQKTRVHGDYHLGQVILERGKWLIIDFEGEPLRSLEERRAKQSPLKDVAGMLRSFNYAAVAALLKRAEPDGDEWLRLEPWAEAWESAVRARFLTAYMTRAHEGHFLPAERDVTAALLDLFEIDKAIYELEYELSHRPDWARIPRRGIEQVIERSTL